MGALSRVLLKSHAPRTTAGVMLCVVSAWASSVAQGACSSIYRSTHHGHSAYLLYFDELANAGALASDYITHEPQSGHESDSQKAPAPCHGALCSGNPVPSTPVAPPTIPPQESIAYFAPANRADPLASRRNTSNDAPLASIDQRDPIFHPPRHN